MIKKTYSKTGRSCRVTFELPPEVNAETAYLCGEFNEWDETADPMKRRKDGRFSLTISLKPGQEYRFRYLLDGERWQNVLVHRDNLPLWGRFCRKCDCPMNTVT